jgi:hypothetical protein
MIDDHEHERDEEPDTQPAEEIVAVLTVHRFDTSGNVEIVDLPPVPPQRD